MSGAKYSSWPTDLQKQSSFRKEYIEALKRADQGDFSSLLNYMKKHIDNTKREE